MKNISKKSLLSFKVAVPPLLEQRRIAEILDTLDDQICDSERLIEKSRQAQAGLLDSLLGGFGLGNTPDQDLERSSSWETATCGELCTDITVGIVVRPTQYYSKSGIPILRSANVRADGLSLDDLKFMSESNHRRLTKTAVRAGDLVTVRTGYPGTTAVIPEDLEEANCVDIIISRPGPRILPDYLAVWINSDHGRGQVLRAQGGLAQQHFNVSEMSSLRVEFPSLPEQQKIVEGWLNYRAKMNSELDLVKKLKLIRRKHSAGNRADYGC